MTKSFYERFMAAGYDLTKCHEMAAFLGLGTSNRPLLGFVKRHRTENPKIQMELNMALGYHVRARNDRGVALCLWAGAEDAVRWGDLRILTKLGPDPARADSILRSMRPTALTVPSFSSSRGSPPTMAAGIFLPREVAKPEIGAKLI
jgi:hypothetical protein